MLRHDTTKKKTPYVSAGKASKACYLVSQQLFNHSRSLLTRVPLIKNPPRTLHTFHISKATFHHGKDPSTSLQNQLILLITTVAPTHSQPLTTIRTFTYIYLRSQKREAKPGREARYGVEMLHNHRQKTIVRNIVALAAGSNGCLNINCNHDQILQVNSKPMSNCPMIRHGALVERISGRMKS